MSQPASTPSIAAIRARILKMLLQRLEAGPRISGLLEAAAKPDENLVVTKARGGALPALLALLRHRLRRPMLVVTSSAERAEALADGLAFFDTGPQLYPGFDTLPFELHEPPLHILSARLRVLSSLAAAGEGDSPPLIVAPVDALAFRPLPREGRAHQIATLQWGESIDLDELAEKLTAMGYAREALVESPGEFAIRGSIVDVYPPDADVPWRLDFFGDQIEQIRHFDPTTQRSLAKDEEHENIRLLATALQESKIAWLRKGRKLGSFFDLLPANTLVVLDGMERIRQRLLRFDDVAARHWHDLQRTHSRKSGDEPNFLIHHGYEPQDWLLNTAQIDTSLSRFQRMISAHLETDLEDVHTDWPVFALEAQSFESIPSQFQQYLDLIRDRFRRGHWVVVVCDNNGQVLRLDELLREAEISAAIVDADSDLRLPPDAARAAPGVLLMVGELHEGFHSPGAGLFIVTDREIFGRYKRRHIYRKAYRGKAVASPTEINRGDFVVHVEHGIGLFEGIRRQTVDGRQTELLEMTYQDGDKLLVPVDKLHLIQKYASADGKTPALDKLGAKKWASRCKKSMEAVRKMAGELLELYARRAAAEGFAYGADTIWQKEFEASFIYQETPDQDKAIEEVKHDMTQPRPMDRLVCGDVGYGKTEVAIRAAFKALVEKRQVAVLAPTTLLVQQHYNTFRERFADYPFRVEMLSRFRSAAQQKEIIRKLETGDIDLVVGTHRLLSRDMRFRDLGLLVVDEEQRFGVAQKEKIKSLRSNVDILTLTATPIPRTLYMALSGLRDLSIITTPPANRLPIKTRTIRFDREAIEEAILRELNRGGQVYFVHNRIENIQEVAQTLREIVPQVKLVVAHGQMDEEELEHIMLDFIDGKYDMLLSTTIIENGIDIPNVNTIIINRADTFGLAQLYQLRGRVGRDVRQAYAYLILPPGQAITPSAIKRLEALEEFTELGMGFSIAMRDMEIRGTGNILGREQHGAITDIGFEMYCRMLEEAVAELKGTGAMEALWPVEIKWPVDQFLPEEYIPVESQRIRFYKDLAGAHRLEDLHELLEELVDRYGPLPPAAVNLVNVARLKLAASPWRIDTIRPSAGNVVRIVAPIFGTELASALGEGASAARGVFSKLRRAGEQLSLELRQPDALEDEPEKILAALADYLEAVLALVPDAAVPTGPALLT